MSNWRDVAGWRDMGGWRGFRRFWLAVGSLLLLTAVVLQILGPPPALLRVATTEHAPPPQAGAKPADTAAAKQTDPAKAHGEAPNHAPRPAAGLPHQTPGRLASGPVAAPDPALLIAAPDSNDKLPRVSADGRVPMAVYAAGFDTSVRLPRVGLLIAGIGMNEADSLAAITQLSGPVTLAVSPYAGPLPAILAAARKAQHEYLLSLPMRPDTFPVDDPDERHALLPSLSPEENMTRLRWLLSRLPGYVGVTSVFGAMRGERLLGFADQTEAVLHDVADRGLLFVAGTATPPLPYVWSRAADMLIDEGTPDAAALDDRLNRLTDLARNKGSALGIVALPRPVTLERLAAWSNGLLAKGVVLAPVSALVHPPGKQEAER